MAEIENDLLQNAAVFARDSGHAAYVAASYFLIARFISHDIANRYWIADERGQMSARTGHRLTTIGEMLFRLRFTPGLIEFCERIRKRSPDVSFINEAFAASIFLENGFRIRAMQDTGAKGKDFDFVARKNGQSICVEVTTIRAPTYSDATLENALAAKVKQLPRDKPSVIVLVLPEAWYDREDLTDQLRRHISRLFGQSKRVNAIMFLGEQHNDIAIDGRELTVLQYRMSHFVNVDPRTPCLALSFLSALRGEDVAVSLSDKASFDILRQEVEARPFHAWVKQHALVAPGG